MLGCGRVLEDGVMYSTAVRLSNRDDLGGNVVHTPGFGESEIFLDMRRQGEVGCSGRGKEVEENGVAAGGSFALVTEWMFLTALKWSTQSLSN